MVDNIQQYDVIILYNSEQARSAADTQHVIESPFPDTEKAKRLKKTYAYFLQQCARKGLRAAFAITADINGAGEFSSVWTYTHKQWHRKIEPAKTDFIFDKFSVHTRTDADPYEVLQVDEGEVQLFHNREVRRLFNNKWKTFKRFPRIAIPTARVGEPTTENIASARTRLRKRISDDTRIEQTKKRFVMKDQFGAGGSHIYSITPESGFEPCCEESEELPFILQPRINATGFSFDDYSGTIDLRVIVVDGNIVQSYIRIAQPDDFRANASLGGEVVYIQPSDVPEKVQTAVHTIHNRLPNNTSFYALDFIRNPDGKIFLVEGNITPGLTWFNEEDERYAKKLIRLIVRRIKKRIEEK